MKVFSADYFRDLSIQASSSARLRQHRNIHLDYQDPCQRMFNAIEPGSYIRPHRHAAEPRDELLIAVCGSLAFFAFDEQGQVTHALRIGGDRSGSEYSLGIEVPSYAWHTVIALEPGSVLLEIKAGPYDPKQPKEVAPWAPEESSSAVAEYLNGLLDLLPLT